MRIQNYAACVAFVLRRSSVCWTPTLRGQIAGGGPAAHRAHLRLHGDASQRAARPRRRRPDRSTSIASCCSFSHSFSDRLRFVGELELEHAFVEGLEEAGEVELEQAYIDVLLKPSFNLRAGMLLVPVGIINERHEPPVFHGVERPFVDTVIIPTTWFDVGAGVHGRIGSTLAYRAYVMAPLDATEFTADEGLRGGIQKGSEANVRNAALTGRVEFTRVAGLTVGLSGWRGDTGFNLPRLDPVGRPRRVRRPLSSSSGFEARGQFARVFIGDAARLNDALTLLIGVAPNIARQLQGYYLEASHLFPLRDGVTSSACSRRFEDFDTQFRMPEGVEPDSRFQSSGVDRGRQLLPRSGCRAEVRLHAPTERGDDSPRAALDQRRHRLVVLTSRLASIVPRVARLGRSGGAERLASCRCRIVIALHRERVGVSASAPMRRDRRRRAGHRRAIRVHAVRDHRAAGHDDRVPAEERGHGARLPHPRPVDRSHDSQARPRRGHRRRSRRRSRAPTSSSVRGCAAPDTASCAASFA